MSRNKILLVDDIKASINILIDFLGDSYDIDYVQDGESVLEYTQDKHPDLILLDILMPGINGYEVCKRLKSCEKTRDIPVIFLTSSSSEEDEIRGFELGAVDYITKPFNYVTVKARVETHLALKNALENLDQKNKELNEMLTLREDMERITRHDLKTPLNNIISYTQLMMLDTHLGEEHRQSLKRIKASAYKMVDTINIGLDLFKMERKIYQPRLTGVDLVAVIEKVLSELQVLLKDRELETAVFINGSPAGSQMDRFEIRSEELLCYSMLFNLAKNAAEASHQEGRITLSLEKLPGGSGSKIQVHNAIPVPEEIRDRFFEKYITALKVNGTGLGTYSAKLIAETLGGSISMETGTSSGTGYSRVCITPVVQGISGLDVKSDANMAGNGIRGYG